MKKSFLLLIFIIPCLHTLAQNFQWAKKLASVNSSQGYGIATDASGNIYTAGSFLGTTDFDPGAGTYNLTPTGAFDVYVCKLNHSGNLIWAKQMGGMGIEQPFALSLDANGNIYTTGYFDGNADFDPGANTFNLTSSGGYDIFISKLDPSGNFKWAKAMGGTGDDFAASIAIDPSGNVYSTGQFEGTVDFNPGGGLFNLISKGGSDCYISKLNSSGGFLWAKQFGDSLDDYGYAINADPTGNVIIAGAFRGTVDFDPGIGQSTLTSAGSNDIFISKLDASGNFIWAKRTGGTTADSPAGIKTDGSGNVYYTGYFTGTADFDPGAGSVNLISSGGFDIFISRLSSSGGFTWARRIGSTLSDVAESIALDSTGNVYTTGRFQGTVDFDPGANISNLTASGNYDIFVSKLDNAGNLVYAKKMGGNGYDDAKDIAVNLSDNVFTTGQFESPADFDPGAPVYNLTTTGNNSCFVSKLGICTPAVVINISSSAPVICPGVCDTLKATGATTYSWSPAAGLSGTSGATVTACPAVTTVYTVIGTNPGGCTTGDASVLVTVNPVPVISPSGNHAICNGSSLLFSIVPPAITYQWKKNGVDITGAISSTYTANSSGSYSAFVTNTCGAYTTASVNLSVNNNPVAVLTAAGDTTFCSGDSVVLNATVASNRSYQWYLYGNIISGATGSGYTAKTGGLYSARVTNTNTGCYDYTNGILISVDPTPNAVFTANGPVSFCTGGNVTFTATEIGPSYQWIKNGTAISGATGQTYFATTSGTYKVRGTNALGCSSTSLPTVVTVTNLPSASVTASGPLTFCAGDSVVFTAASGSGFSYKWKKNGSNISGATQKKYTAKTAGTYKVTVTKSPSGCSATSNGKVVTVPCKAPENEFSGPGGFAVYPNPSSGIFNFDFVSDNNQAGGLIEIYTVTGQCIFTKEIAAFKGDNHLELDLTALAPGMYFLHFKSNGVHFNVKILRR